ncbi:hexose transporter [Flagelloscypha sp. PMI_526]|nr:hexose transporter [Flagelloscypha sp. PMI_526]
MAGGAGPSSNSRVAELAANDPIPWYRKRNLRTLYFIMFPAAIGVEWASGFDGSIMNGLQSVATWDNYFGKPRGAKLGVMSAIYSLGALSSMPITPWVNEKYGRRASVIVGSVIMCIGAVLQAASVHFGMFLLARFILGMGITYALSGGSQLVGELSYNRERPILTSAYNVCWYIGGIVAAGVTLGTFRIPTDWAWRIPSILQIVPSAFQLVFIWWLPESPRWLITQGREEQAKQILIKYHGEGEETEYVQLEYAEMVATIKMEIEADKIGWMDLVREKANLKRCALVAFIGTFSQWSGNGLVSYYLARVLETVGITDKRTQNKVNVGLNCWNLVTGIIASWAVGRTKRRHMYLWAVSVMWMTFVSWTAASAVFNVDHTNQHAAGAVVAMIFIYYGFGYNAAPLTYTYTIEIFPTMLRPKGTVVVQTFSKLAGAFNTFVNPIGLADIGWKYYIVYVVWLFIEGVVIFFTFPETSNKSLEELAFMFEGEEKELEAIQRTDAELGGHEESSIEKSTSKEEKEV